MRLCYLILIVCLMVPGLPSSAQSQTFEPRSEIKLFQYRGAETGGNAEAQFEVFRGILEDKIANLYWELRSAQETGSDVGDLDFFGQVTLSDPLDDEFRNSNAVRSWIQSDPSVLQVMRGTVFEQNGDFRFKTRSWFSHEPMAEPLMVPLDMAFNKDGFANSRDTHSLAIFLAVAIEAKRVNIRRDLIAAIVADALNSLADLERRDALNTADVQRLKALWLEFKRDL